LAQISQKIGKKNFPPLQKFDLFIKFTLKIFKKVVGYLMVFERN